ncbi:aldolase catalytic domain-containing protein [Candidatus Pantoea floridensis]|uniref:4-hydroxy 2-oxovalerate aldolase n=1 Tax=Candidatus Pantoea floridensis TaxID=1938870 RepID=A0A286BVK4_9GAMM|nr:aldolase catalytic domain-containing protein [Pantoea floridensis]PIF20672.1 4-hydroxy 2-oxovalerate aldolase [Enterobacteriaceae bacterium JKS000233]SOD38189.1 4-hydroxy 2-oxovalerate aldolase [Pantoea floridensis]
MFILDCTLRDGGYYNNWDFPDNIVTSYLKSAAEANIDYIELGLRNFPQSGFLGAYAYTTEQHLNTLELPSGPTYGVMVDAKTILSASIGIENALEKLFVPAEKSKVKLVRVAAHFNEVEHSAPIVKKLKEMGYLVGYNLMQAGGKPDHIIAEKARLAREWDVLDVLYFADSLGNMDSLEVERIISALRTEWRGPIGIHTHNNMGKGLDNTITAIDKGVTWVDSTITGMGRGAGNTQTEYLLAILDKNNKKYNPSPIYDLVIRHFETMQKEYGWGSNLLYFLGAQNDVHPTYIQNLLSNTHYETDEIVGAIKYLSDLEGATSYNGSVLDSALKFNSDLVPPSGTALIENKFLAQDVLLLANGSTCERYKKSIELYIKLKKPIVISVNLNKHINESLIDYIVVSHNVKFLSEFHKYKKLNKTLILPKHRFSCSEMLEIEHLNIIDVGFNSSSTTYSIKNYVVNSPYDLTSAYVLGLLAMANPKSIKLVGFDGYGKGDHRQHEMLEILGEYKKLSPKCELTSLTPTEYPVNQGSIHAIHS